MIFTALVADCFDIEDEILADTLDDDETEGRIAVEFNAGVVTIAALPLLGACRESKALGASALTDRLSSAETLANVCNTSDDDETEGRPVGGSGVMSMGTVASVLVWDCEVHTRLVGVFFDIVDEMFADSSDDDGTEGVKNIVATCVRGSSVSDKKFGAAAALTDCLETDGVTNVFIVDATEGDTLV